MPRWFSLAPLFLLTAVFAEIPDPFPVDPPRHTELFATAGLQPVPGLGLRYRTGGRTEFTLHLGLLPKIQTVDVGLNFFADNLEPAKRGTWYGGPGLWYYREDGSVGKFNIGHIYAVVGKEMRIADAWRWNWEAGLAAIVFHTFEGGGAPILLPVLPMARLELLYQLKGAN